MKPSSTHHRAPFLAVVAGLWLAAAVVKGAVRPWVGPHATEAVQLLLNTMPSLVGGLSVPLCFLAVHPRPHASDVSRACLWSLAIVVLAEGLERSLPRSTFDWLDLTVSVLGVGVAGLIAGAFLRVTDPRAPVS
jgi:apolipoprotein N-acyltransferase